MFNFDEFLIDSYLDSNNAPVLKEYVNYIVKRRKGLKLLINEIIKSI